MVSEDLDGEEGSVEVVSPDFQGTDDCKEFTVIDVIVLFSGDEGLGEVGAGVPIAVRVSLEEDSARGTLQGIDGNDKRLGEVREMEDWS